MRVLRWLGLACGLAALGALVAGGGVHAIGAALARGGFRLLAVPAFMLLPLAADAKGWQVLVPDPPALRHFAYARWVGESVNSLLPVAQVGGLVVKAYLLARREVAPGLAGASVLVAVTLAVASLIVFIVAGLALMLSHDPHSRILLPLAVGVAVFTVPVYVFYRLQRRGRLPLPGWLRQRLARYARLIGQEGSGDDLGRSLQRIYGAGWRLRWSFLLQLGGWLMGAGEVWLIAHLLGVPLSAVDALILESLIQAVRNVAFFVPGALGLQEGAFVLLGAAFGLSPAMSLSISLVKRFRELALGIPGLLVWQLSEGWASLSGAR